MLKQSFIRKVSRTGHRYTHFTARCPAMLQLKVCYCNNARPVGARRPTSLWLCLSPYLLHQHGAPCSQGAAAVLHQFCRGPSCPSHCQHWTLAARRRHANLFCRSSSSSQATPEETFCLGLQSSVLSWLRALLSSRPFWTLITSLYVLSNPCCTSMIDQHVTTARRGANTVEKQTGPHATQPATRVPNAPAARTPSSSTWFILWPCC